MKEENVGKKMLSSDLLSSVVVPAYNEKEVFPEFHRRLTKHS